MTPTELSAMIETSIRTLLTDHTITTFLRKTSDAVRTGLIKNNLCELGKKLGFYVSASGCAADGGEWLYDMVWGTMENDLFVHQAMVMECEWRMGVPVLKGADVDSDFQKLVQARADIRVWICTVANDEIAQKHIENCENQIGKFTGTMPNDRYIFVILMFKRDNFELRTYSSP
jgi:hypothetical protein